MPQMGDSGMNPAVVDDGVVVGVGIFGYHCY